MEGYLNAVRVPLSINLGSHCILYLRVHVLSTRAEPPDLPHEVLSLPGPPRWRCLHAAQHSFLYHEQQASGGYDHQEGKDRRKHRGAPADRARDHRGPKVYNRAVSRSSRLLHPEVLPARKHSVSGWCVQYLVAF